MLTAWVWPKHRLGFFIFSLVVRISDALENVALVIATFAGWLDIGVIVPSALASRNNAIRRQCLICEFFIAMRTRNRLPIAECLQQPLLTIRSVDIAAAPVALWTPSVESQPHF